MGRSRPPGSSGGSTGSGYSGFNPYIEREQHMLIVASNSDLAEFSEMMFGQIEATLEAHGGRINVTREQFLKYCATAIKVRVEHVTKKDWRRLGHEYTGMNVHEGWALPVPLHDVLSSIGQARVGTGEILIKPVWDQQADDLTLQKEERDLITRELRSACSAIGIRTMLEMSSDIDGHYQTMVLVNVPSLNEWWHHDPIKREDAAAALIAGITPVTQVTRGAGGAEYAVVDVSSLASSLAQLPIWVPEYRMERRVVVRYLTEVSKLAA